MDNELNKTNGATEVEPTEEKTTYTREEVELLLQKEGDRRVTAALKKQAEKAARKEREATKLANMSAEDKYRYELEKREAAIIEKERQLVLSENKNAASKVLADKGLDLSLVDFVLAEDAEQMYNNINVLDKAFRKSVKAEVEKRLANKSPQSTIDVNKSYTDKDFSKMSLSEIQEVLNSQK